MTTGQQWDQANYQRYHEGQHCAPPQAIFVRDVFCAFIKLNKISRKATNIGMAWRMGARWIPLFPISVCCVIHSEKKQGDNLSSALKRKRFLHHVDYGKTHHAFVTWVNMPRISHEQSLKGDS